MRVLDELMAHPQVVQDMKNVEKLLRKHRENANRIFIPGTPGLASAVAFDIQNVAEYFFEHNRKEVLPDNFEELVASWVPPFDSSWFEYHWKDARLTAGIHCHTVDLYATDDPETAQRVAEHVLHSAGESMEPEVTFRLAGPVRWISYWFPRYRKDGELKGPMADVRVFITPDGKIARLSPREDQLAIVVAPISEAFTVEPTEEELKNIQLLCMRLLGPAFLALGFMACKNVETAIASEVPERIRRRREKKTGRPLVEYKTLTIDPMKKTLSAEGGIEHVGLHRALHICRGHFVTYSEDKPLFGKYSGTYWKPAHVRGSMSEGAVVKDYRVKSA